jgi:hypothetical protein
MFKMTYKTGTVQLISDHHHQLIYDAKPPQPAGGDSTRPEEATRREHQHPINTITQPSASQPKPVRIEVPKETDLHVQIGLPYDLQLGHDDLLVTPSTTKVDTICPDELGDKLRPPIIHHTNPANVAQQLETTALSVQRSSTVHTPSKRRGHAPLIKVFQLRGAE